MARQGIEELEIYQLGMQIGASIHDMVIKWNNFEKNSMGYQLVKAADSIAANISEGYGRFHYKEQRQFCYIARGSLFETKTWLSKAQERLPDDLKTISALLEMLDLLVKKLNAYIKYIERNIN